MSNSLVAIPAGWPGPAAPRCRPTVFYRPGLWPGPGAHWQRPLAIAKTPPDEQVGARDGV